VKKNLAEGKDIALPVKDTWRLSYGELVSRGIVVCRRQWDWALEGWLSIRKGETIYKVGHINLQLAFIDYPLLFIRNYCKLLFIANACF